MNRKRLLVIVLIAVLAIGATSVFSQEPIQDEPVSPESSWGEYLSGATGTWGTRWRHLAASGQTFGVRGEAASTSGRGVMGWAYSPTGIVYGVWGVTPSTGGFGVVGHATATTGATNGVRGLSASASGVGVYGAALGSYATGVEAQGNRYGVRAYASSTTGDAVYARATATSGPAWAINASTYSADGWAGVFNSSGNGIQSIASSTYGVFGRSLADGGYGMYGTASGSGATGVYGTADRYGLRAYASSTFGDAVYARATATSGPAWAVNAYTSSPDGWAGVFTSAGNGVSISTPSGKVGLTVSGGTKNAAVATDEGDRLLYTEESTEVWFTDYGFGQLEAGRAVITIDPLFAQTVNLSEGYHVFVQAYGNTNLYVSERTPTYFVVRAPGARGNANFEFSYRLVAKRVGYEADRLEQYGTDGTGILALSGEKVDAPMAEELQPLQTMKRDIAVQEIPLIEQELAPLPEPGMEK